MIKSVYLPTSRRGLATQATQATPHLQLPLFFAERRSLDAYRITLSPHSRSTRLSSPNPSRSIKWFSSIHSQAALTRRRTFSTRTKIQSWWRGSGMSSPVDHDGAPSFETQPMEIPEEAPGESERLPTRRVHILGLGSIGTLIAHSLKCMPNPPPITLLMHKGEMYGKFRKQYQTIRLLNKKTDIDDEQSGYDVDLLEVDPETELPYWRHINLSGDTQSAGLQPEEQTESQEVYIYTLIVTVKGPATVSALASVKHRVNEHTTICLMQNGMGQVDELNRLVFTDPATRPTYMLGIISHGAHLRGAFHVVHAGFGTTALGIHRDTDKYPLPPKSSTLSIQELSEEDRARMYPSDKDLYSNLSSRYLLRTLTRSPVLACAPFPYLDLFQLQLEKLCMNAVLNPLTALLNVPNGSMLDNDSLTRVQRLLLAEISIVLRGLPELEGMPGVNLRFSAGRLEALVVSLAKTTAKNSSSMREDVRNLKRTEIEYINGYVVRRGEEQGIKCVLNYMIMQLIEAKTFMSRFDTIKPYGTSSIDGEIMQSSSVVDLDDTGTQNKGRPY